ncbi:MAG: hypothetical protein AB7L09_02285 [Nitrospira sp.]
MNSVPSTNGTNARTLLVAEVSKEIAARIDRLWQLDRFRNKPHARLGIITIHYGPWLMIFNEKGNSIYCATPHTGDWVYTCDLDYCQNVVLPFLERTFVLEDLAAL